MHSTLRLVAGMAIMRLISGTLELLAAILMVQYKSVETALRINGFLGFIGPLILILVTTLGITGLSTSLATHKIVFVVLGFLCILWGTR